MIEIIGRTTIIPKEDIFIGFEGDNRVHTVKILIRDFSIEHLHFKIDVMQKNRNIAEPKKEVTDEGILLKWEIRKEHMQKSGDLFAQVRAFDDEGQIIWHSDVIAFNVKKSINAVDEFQSPLPSEFEEIEQKVAKASAEATNAAEAAKNSANASEQAKEKALTSEQMSRRSEEAAKTSEKSAENAKNTSLEAAERATNSLLNGISEHDRNINSHPNILQKVEEIEAKADGASVSDTYETYQDMVLSINAMGIDEMRRGRNINIVQMNVPDLWVAYITDNIPYEYSTEEEFIKTLKENGIIQVGHYQLAMLETQKVNLNDYVKTEAFRSALNDNKIKTMTEEEYAEAAFAGELEADTIYFVGV